MAFLEIQNLQVKTEDKEIVKGIDLELEKGKVYVIQGPNGGGKSTLANALMGHPKYKVSGRVLFEGKDILEISTDERAKLGLFMSFQYPVEIKGVTISNFLRVAYNSVHENKLSVLEFQELLMEKTDELQINPEFLSRHLNESFSGGEKKRMEILQLLVLNPKLAILDETDSGLDENSLKIIAQGINNFKSKDNCVLIITHYKQFIELIKPDKIFTLEQGKIKI